MSERVQATLSADGRCAVVRVPLRIRRRRGRKEIKHRRPEDMPLSPVCAAHSSVIGRRGRVPKAYVIRVTHESPGEQRSRTSLPSDRADCQQVASRRSRQASSLSHAASDALLPSLRLDAVPTTR